MYIYMYTVADFLTPPPRQISFANNTTTIRVSNTICQISFAYTVN